MKRMLLFGCLAGALAVTACERLDLWINPPADEVGEPLVFTLDEDPGEENDLAGAKPEIEEHLKALMREAHVPNPDFPVLPGE